MHTPGLLLFLVAAASAAGDWRGELASAVQLHGNGDLSRATVHYKAALSQHEPLQHHWPVLNNFGLAVQPDAPAEAAAAFRRVIALVPTGADGYFNLGNALSDCGHHAEAVTAYQGCVDLSPADAEAYYNLGTAFLHAGRGGDGTGEVVKEALGALGVAVALSPSDGKAWLSFGDAFSHGRRFEEAAPMYTRACALRPDHGASWASAGNCQDEMGNAAEAEAHWRTSLALSPSDGATYQNLGGMLRRVDRISESRSSYENVISLQPDNAEGYIGLGKSYQAPPGSLDPDAQAAMHASYARFLSRTYGVATSLQPSNAGAYNAIAEGLTMFGVHGKRSELGGRSALDFYRKALALAPSNTCAATHVAFGSAAAAVECQDEGEGSLTSRGEDAAGEAGPDEAAAVEGEEEGPFDAGGGLEPSGAGGAAPGLSQISVQLPPGSSPICGEALRRARLTWRRQGVVVFPALLSTAAVEALRGRVSDAVGGNGTRDYTGVTRNSHCRVHKSLPVEQARAALRELGTRLEPFLETALGSAELHLLESGFMVTSPGASCQQMHRDVAPAVVSRSSLTASLQVSLVDTAPEQGALEVVPGSQVFDPSVSDRDLLRGAPDKALPVAVPAGSVVIYALHLLHRGRANSHSNDRPFYFFTLTGGMHPPPGLAYTIQSEDIGLWRLQKGSPQEVSTS